MSKIDEVKLALAELRDVATRVREHTTELNTSASDTTQLDEVLAMVQDITVQLQGTLPAEEHDRPATAAD